MANSKDLDASDAVWTSSTFTPVVLATGTFPTGTTFRVAWKTNGVVTLTWPKTWKKKDLTYRSLLPKGVGCF